MSKKNLKTPIVVELRKGKHKGQRWSVRIDMGSNTIPETLAERYSVRRSAYRAALRSLGLWDSTPGAKNVGPWTHKGRKVQFVTR